MFSFLKKSKTAATVPWAVDIHSHLLPGLDDGVKSIEESIYILKIFQRLGYKKIITTPHVMSDHYPNSNIDILTKLKLVKEAMRKNNMRIQLEAAAEYYLDEAFIDKISSKEELLTFGENYLLFETSFFNKPAFMEEAIFNMNAQGYQPVLAHPERYAYILNDLQLLKKLKNMNLLLQMNMLSLSGYYSKDVKQFSKKLLKSNLIDFIGSDCHNALQANEMANMLNRRNIEAFNLQKLLNRSLLSR
jgi:tyrosine-protein phosphatase YwqE